MRQPHILKPLAATLLTLAAATAEAALMDYAGAWKATTPYALGQVVSHRDQSFYALKANQNANPLKNPLAWRLIGTNGNTIQSGTGAPVAALGNIGDFYIDTQNNALYGPKTSTGWPGASTSLVGPKGDTGPQGPAGAVGPRGPQGPIGKTGPQGEMGLQGPQGPIGLTGTEGPMGPAGAQGAVGATGPQGPAGIAGPAGPKGDTGATGPQGLKGDTGATGPQGPQGQTGATGPQGPVGPQGPKGDIGQIGPPGGVKIFDGTGKYLGISADGKTVWNASLHMFMEFVNTSFPRIMVPVYGGNPTNGIERPQNLQELTYFYSDKNCSGQEYYGIKIWFNDGVINPEPRLLTGSFVDGNYYVIDNSSMLFRALSEDVISTNVWYFWRLNQDNQMVCSPSRLVDKSMAIPKASFIEIGDISYTAPLKFIDNQ